MRVMVLVKATKDSEAGAMPSTELLEAMGRYNEELVKAGVMLAGEGLRPSSRASAWPSTAPSRTVIDGPFAETRELVAGYWLWEVKDMAEAVEWVKRCPNPMPGPSEIEIRPVFEIGRLRRAVTPEVAELHDRDARKGGRPLSLPPPRLALPPRLPKRGRWRRAKPIRRSRRSSGSSGPGSSPAWPGWCATSAGRGAGAGRLRRRARPNGRGPASRTIPAPG